MCLALPGLYAFTGCDYTVSFAHKGKLCPLSLMEKNGALLRILLNLVIPWGSLDLAAKLEVFVCLKQMLTSTNKTRYMLFQQHFAPLISSEPLSKIKGTEPSNMPPCQVVLHEKIKRANFMASVWKRAATAEPQLWHPSDHGWNMGNGQYCIKWFHGC